MNWKTKLNPTNLEIGKTYRVKSNLLLGHSYYGVLFSISMRDYIGKELKITDAFKLSGGHMGYTSEHIQWTFIAEWFEGFPDADEKDITRR